MIDSPKVSVLLPIYNTHPQHLRECIASILSQTFADFEFLILNDSPENTELDAIVASFEDPRIIYKKNERNLGISASRNKLLDAARGEYLAVMDHDDISLPQRFEREVAYMDTHPEVGVCSCWAECFPKPHLLRFPTEDVDIKVMFMDDCPIMHPAAMIRRAVLTQHNIRYEEEFSLCEDFCLWLRLIEYTRFHNIPEVLFRYRWHTDNVSKQQQRKMVQATSRLRSSARKKYPCLFDAWLNASSSVWNAKLFRVLPLFKLVKCGRQATLYLFNHIPIMRITKKRKEWPK